MKELCFRVDTETGEFRITYDVDAKIQEVVTDEKKAVMTEEYPESVAQKQGIDLDLDKWKVMLYRHGSPICFWYDRRII